MGETTPSAAPATGVLGIGAIIGDMVGSPYEFDHNNIKTEDFPLFSERSYATDDTVMTLAVADGLVKTWGQDESAVTAGLITSMVREGRAYPNAGYGARFSDWLRHPVPYGSYGNGSAMRVSPVGWLFDQLTDVLKYAALTAAVSHNHPEGIRGAQATAAAIFLTRHGLSKERLKTYLTRQYGYDLERSLADIRPQYRHVESCQETVPEAIIAYLEGQDFEDVLRKAVSLGGDSDTLTAIAASIAEARYPVPDGIRQQALTRLDAHQRALLNSYSQCLTQHSLERKAHQEKLLALIPNFMDYNNAQSLDELSCLAAHDSITVHDYAEILDIFDITPNRDAFENALSHAGLLPLRTMLTFFVRSERFCHGSLEESAKCGIIGKIFATLRKKLFPQGM